MDLGLSFEVVDAQLAEVAPVAPFKECGCCERTYTRRQWLRLPYVGAQRMDGCPERTLSLRECGCGTTLAVLASQERLSHGLESEGVTEGLTEYAPGHPGHPVTCMRRCCRTESKGVTEVDLTVRFPRGWGGVR